MTNFATIFFKKMFFVYMLNDDDAMVMVVAVEMGKWSTGLLFPFLPHPYKILRKSPTYLIN